MKRFGAVVVIVLAAPAAVIVARRLSSGSSPTVATAIATRNSAPIAARPTVPALGAVADSATDASVTAFRSKRNAGADPAERLATLDAMAVDRPGAALELALSEAATDEQRAEWAGALISHWAGRDPEAAWDWLLGHADRLGQLAPAPLLGDVWREMASRDPQLVVKYADQFLADPNRPSGLAAQIVAQSAVQALLSRGAADNACVIVEFWAHSPLADQVGAGTFTDVARSLGNASPENAVTWLKSIPASADRNVALGEIAADGIGRDPATTLGWASSLPAEEGRATVVQRAFSEWTERNPADAGRWLADQLARGQPPADADAMIASLVNGSSLIHSNPTEALAWVGHMSDAAQRADAHDQVLLRWASTDPAAANSYLQQDSSLDANHRATLVQRMQAQQAAPDREGPWFATDSVAKPGG